MAHESRLSAWIADVPPGWYSDRQSNWVTL